MTNDRGHDPLSAHSPPDTTPPRVWQQGISYLGIVARTTDGNAQQGNVNKAIPGPSGRAAVSDQVPAGGRRGMPDHPQAEILEAATEGKADRGGLKRNTV